MTTRRYKDFFGGSGEHRTDLTVACKRSHLLEHEPHYTPGGPGQRAVRWPMAVVEAMRPEWTTVDWCVLAGTQRRSWARWRHGGLPDAIADRVAIRLGYHPIELWPEWLDVVELDDEAA